MEVELLVPEVRRASLEEVVALLSERTESLAPFSDSCIDFCAGLSQAIFRDHEASRFPELLALAFWMRKAGTYRIAISISSYGPNGGARGSMRHGISYTAE